MNETLLVTKLAAPQTRPGMVIRDRLNRRLDEGLERRLTLVSAPAGFGKTSLVSAWYNQLDVPKGWLGLDEDDNDPARFLTYFLTVLGKSHPGLDEQVVAVPSSLQLAQVEAIAIPVINALAGAEHDGVLVLDDYHLIDNENVRAFVGFFIERVPVHVHVILLTRADPPLPLSRFRARGEMVEVRAADLRFTFDEICEFMRSSSNLALADENITAIQSKTEGWAAGLKLAALSLNKNDDPGRFIQEFGGSHEYIADYLADEVLAGLPDHVKTFLLDTSILDRMAGDLCRAVTGREDGQAVLECLERENLFITPLDEKRQWFRYHQLFSDLLRQRLLQTQPERVTGLHRRAGDWFLQHGMAPEAIHHALAAEDWDLAAQIIEQEAVPFLLRGEFVTFINWVNKLPDDLVCRFPELGAYEVYARLFSGSPLHTIVARMPEIDAGGREDGRVLAIHALFAVFQGRATDAVELAGRALDLLPEKLVLVHSLALWSLLAGRVLRGDEPNDAHLFDRLIRLGSATNNTVMTVLALCSSAKLRMREGRLYEARDLYRRALDLSSFPHGRLYIAGQPLAGLGALYYEWNELEQAAGYLAEGIELSRRWGTTSIIEGFFSLAGIRQMNGDEAGADEAMRQAREMALQFDVSDIDDFLVGYHQARLWILRGNFPPVQRWLDSRLQLSMHQTGVDITRHLAAYEDLIRAWLLVVQNDPRGALQILEPMSSVTGRHSLLIECAIFKAVAYRKLNENDKAMESFRQALALAKPGNYVRTFLDKGAMVRGLLADAQENNVFPDYVRGLLGGMPAPLQGGLVEPLSERELEILQMIGAGKSNRQIADELYLAVGTVKAHASNIYGKLGVKNRAQAVLQARQLELL